jgi:hypothetical protein
LPPPFWIAIWTFETVLDPPVSAEEPARAAGRLVAL